MVPAPALGAGQARWRRGVAVAVVLAVGGYAFTQTGRSADGLRHRERSFFGSFTVVEGGEGPVRRRHFNHGGTMHGVQFLHPDRQAQPTSYFGIGTGIGLLLPLRTQGVERRVGVIGLGIGTLAAYGYPEETFRFYEIDPAVARIAQDTEHFTMLSGSAARTEVAVGDGRLLLEADVVRAGGYVHDFLIIDAFSSGSIPVHLLTREAFELYAEALHPTSVLAFHITNRHFDLAPLVARMAGEVGMHSLYVKTLTQRQRFSEGADWMVLTRQAALRDTLARAMRQRANALGMPPGAAQITPMDAVQVAHVRIWTDDYSDLFGALKPRGR